MSFVYRGKHRITEARWERMRVIVKYRIQGFDELEIAQSFGVHPSIIRKDFILINELEDLELAAITVEEVAKKISSEEKEIKRELWLILENTGNQSVRLGALKQLAAINKETVGVLQDIGKLPRSGGDNGNDISDSPFDREYQEFLDKAEILSEG